MIKTRGELEAQFTKAIIQLEKEHFGRGPLEARTFFVTDMVLVRLKGVLTPAEVKLAENREGQALVKETRRQLFEVSRPLVENIVKEVIGCNLISLHTDMSTKTGERMIVLTVDIDLDEQFPKRTKPGR
ncbi:MAG: DUF2294 domain-containing protein [Anaerolineae bacterium]|nr:DUF2294 domain-containing protein [Anaerolineae bacterium]